MATDYSIKPQPTLKGYYGWSFRQVLKVLQLSPAEGAAYIFQDWLTLDRERTEREFGISVERFKKQVKNRKELMEEMEDEMEEQISKKA